MVREEYKDKILIGYYTAVGGFYMVRQDVQNIAGAKRAASWLFDRYKENGWTCTLVKLRGITCVQIRLNDEVLFQYGSC